MFYLTVTLDSAVRSSVKPKDNMAASSLIKDVEASVNYKLILVIRNTFFFARYNVMLIRTLHTYICTALTLSENSNKPTKLLQNIKCLQTQHHLLIITDWRHHRQSERYRHICQYKVNFIKFVYKIFHWKLWLFACVERENKKLSHICAFYLLDLRDISKCCSGRKNGLKKSRCWVLNFHLLYNIMKIKVKFANYLWRFSGVLFSKICL